MDYEKTLEELKHMKVETGSFVCLGCGNEHNCSIHGCAILRDAVECIEELKRVLQESEAARADLGKRLAAAQQDLAAYKDTGLEPEDIKKHEAAYNECLTRTYGPFKQKISQWLQAEQDGRLVVLPCKAGDHVWVDGREAVVENFFGYETERYLHAQFYDNKQYIDIPFTEIGKTVFLTREEAEAAMAGKGGAPSDAPEELVEAEWKNRLMRTVKEKQNGV